MLSPKQNLLETMKEEGRPDRWVNQYEAFKVIRNDPIMQNQFPNKAPEDRSAIDRFGTLCIWPVGMSSYTPHVTEETKVLKDITCWREQVKFPDLAATCSEGWEEALASAAAVDRDSYMVTGYMPTGIFEQAHFLMGFEDVLVNLYEEPDDMHDFLIALKDYRMSYAKLLIEKLHPDAILYHDDWGSKDNLFMSPDTWREFFKPLYQELYGYIKSQGIMIIHHADSHCQLIVEDMVDIGIDIWQGVLPQNDIPKIQEILGARMSLMGGIDTAMIDRADSSEEFVREETRRACEAYCPGGHFIPSFTYGGPHSIIYPGIKQWIVNEIEQCNRKTFPEVYK